MAIKKVLVANRGEIAVRVIRACHQMGIRAVAVFSDADRDALHVRYADEAVHLGPPEPARSYLDQDKILAACELTGADALHPGYGFLAENAGFARRVLDAGVIFIGPTPAAIEGMGDKINSRELMIKAGVPVIPGRSDVTEHNLMEVAEEVGFPLMLKATAGGGGKGIRVVREASELASAFARSRGEAETAFGNGVVYAERLVEQPHHIEVQLLADNHGNVVHLFERECSVQRRHQKVVEEAPSAFMTDDLRARMGDAARLAAKAIGYTNAGTVEFLVDRHREFYFLEMNTRLQVEHPITELITGVDLVRQQIRVAEGQPLEFTQDDLRIHGHAIEVRICAEDPEHGFVPSIGRVDSLVLPGGPGVRIDSFLTVGTEVSLHYDSMLGKLICWGRDRNEAIQRMRQALSEFRVADLKTNVAYASRILRNEEFVSGTYDTGVLERMGSMAVPEHVRDAAAVAAVLSSLGAGPKKRSATTATRTGLDPWTLAGRPGAWGGRWS